MSHFSNQPAPRVAALLMSVLALGASAQTPHNHALTTEMKPAAAPTTAVAPVAPTASSSSSLRYESVFARYQSYRDEKTGSWREANETVDRIGGWRAYAKEAQRPDAGAPSTPVAPTPPQPQATKPNPHSGHGSKP